MENIKYIKEEDLTDEYIAEKDIGYGYGDGSGSGSGSGSGDGYGYGYKN